MIFLFSFLRRNHFWRRIKNRFNFICRSIYFCVLHLMRWSQTSMNPYPDTLFGWPDLDSCWNLDFLSTYKKAVIFKNLKVRPPLRPKLLPFFVGFGCKQTKKKILFQAFLLRNKHAETVYQQDITMNYQGRNLFIFCAYRNQRTFSSYLNFTKHYSNEKALNLRQQHPSTMKLQTFIKPKEHSILRTYHHTDSINKTIKTNHSFICIESLSG